VLSTVVERRSWRRRQLGAGGLAHRVRGAGARARSGCAPVGLMLVPFPRRAPQFLAVDPATGSGHQDDMLFFVRPPQQQAPADGKARVAGGA